MSQKYRDMKIIEEVKDLRKNGSHVPIALEGAYREVISRQWLKESYSRAISSKLLPDGKLFSVIYKTILN